MSAWAAEEYALRVEWIWQRSSCALTLLPSHLNTNFCVVFDVALYGDASALRQHNHTAIHVASDLAALELWVAALALHLHTTVHVQFIFDIALSKGASTPHLEHCKDNSFRLHLPSLIK